MCREGVQGGDVHSLCENLVSRNWKEGEVHQGALQKICDSYLLNLLRKPTGDKRTKAKDP